MRWNELGKSQNRLYPGYGFYLLTSHKLCKEHKGELAHLVAPVPITPHFISLKAQQFANNYRTAHHKFIHLKFNAVEHP